MSPWQMLVTTDYGILTLVVIGITLAMGVGFAGFLIKHVKDRP
jgi:hypothetical protein